ncbi:substrate-binding periplasmic protein [Bifidobacterium subtile]|uniref:Polar amino acid ABC transporter binding protein component n=2 Tax=Bifidobacterium subtile TaxID=77635 RepID=A0A087EAI7_9BIFI|nr:transporter substrate-binding domain-containing protein [Bifidobacterium subtile]KFJ04788.1 polar amino acid ABC transporter binding protein component [Bifidobacterium subtile]
MKNPMHPILAAAVVTLMIGTMAACGSPSGSGASSSSCKPAHDFSTITKGTLTVAIPELPPFTSYKNNKATGIDPSIVSSIAKMECLSVSYSQVAFAEAIPAVQSGRADIAIGDFYRTKERAQVVGMSDAMYADQLGIVSKTGASSLASLESKKVGTVDGYLWLDDTKKIWGDNLTIYSSNVEMRQDLESGRIAAGFDSYATAVAYSKGKDYQSKVAQKDKRVDSTINGVQAGIPYTKTNEDLGKALNADIGTLRSKGTLAKIFSDLGMDTSATKITSRPLI